jgi:hypothetical protein
MDNYFTYPDVIKGITDLDVGVVGTACARRGWPPKEMRDIADNCFNTVYLMNDRKGFKIIHWVDNNVVTMVSNVHTGEEVVTRECRCPRESNVNRQALRTFWREAAVRMIDIPGCIDDYNHWMLGVDVSDQYIAYYHPAVKCYRTWMPIMFHCLDCL